MCLWFVQANGTRDPKLYVWDVELDLIQFFNFATGCDESDDVTRQPSAAAGDAHVTAAERFHWLTYLHTHTHTHLTALFWDYSGEPVPEK